MSARFDERRERRDRVKARSGTGMRLRWGAAMAFTWAALATPGVAVAQPAAAAAPGSAVRPAPSPDAEEAARPARRFVSRRNGTFGGTRVQYVASVEETFLHDEAGRRTASLFSTSYVRTGLPRDAVRPVVFAFNGGPGSASIWLHMGALGPRRVLYDDPVGPEEVHPRTAPPFRLGDNPDSVLDVADVVLFDPPGTGYSRIIGAGEAKQFYGVQQDARATAEFIQDWLRRHDRWNSPKFLVGESYGTIRAAVVARLLAGGPTETGRMDAVTLNGVVLLGQHMDFSGASADYRPALDLPTLAAVAWYHGKVDRGPGLQAHVDAARAFAADDYLRALFAGSRLPETERRRVADRLAALTGLPPQFLLERELRVDAAAFAGELLRPEGRQLGLYDGRFVLPRRASGGDPVADDPAMGQYVPVYVAGLDRYFRQELGVRLDLPYNAIEFREVNAQWERMDRNHAHDLAVAMRRNPALRLFVGTGYYDLATTLGAAEYTVARSGIDPARVRYAYYESGHMPYIGEASRRRLAEDLRGFIREATGAPVR